MIPNTRVHMVRRSGRFRADMNPAVLQFVEFVHASGEADTIVKLGSAVDAFSCDLCGSPVVDTDSGAQLCTKCPLCNHTHHAHCIGQQLGDDTLVFDAVVDFVRCQGGTASLDSVLNALGSVFAGPAANLQPRPSDVLCALCSKLVARALNGHRGAT